MGKKTVYLKDIENLNTISFDSQEIESILQYLGSNINPEIITGITCDVIEGDLWNVYLTESSSPWDLSSIWHSLDYYQA